MFVLSRMNVEDANKKLKADKSIAIQNEFARGYKLVNGL